MFCETETGVGICDNKLFVLEVNEKGEVVNITWLCGNCNMGNKLSYRYCNICDEEMTIMPKWVKTWIPSRDRCRLEIDSIGNIEKEYE